jgi:hypothetical protein
MDTTNFSETMANPLTAKYKSIMAITKQRKLGRL